jgi:hypothetical protein
MQEESTEIIVLNIILILFALGSLGIGVWTIISDGFKAGTDDLCWCVCCWRCFSRSVRIPGLTTRG